ncbi:MAG: ABC transporter permease [Candidatus Phytoplasma stylosanthis]|uniref:ABC transporter permease n=1 Tax=Candidatus Phytoplasma stylosanthis TaxID=2798314 RepID=UPI00293B49FB|nr:ABC transporter permease [Candidatus Phytoplasma stylosanthis]MDV3167760.1 ABC transporter permease [Candidatus Phytoplasma stylosanthis]MDV3170963.1 ABC transporter permease [Candidatus Phytoplasma stylosanthis]MDV3173654.1 ABC transporter permease [Candidatus Phytoplasma stylosanthis]MDV3174135.1 ABC transporter permease [Candidatus Phytoplasma stylosanthis]MDV3202346.1 ABC transporter permease [Candidatus Phytoplasma stylosanthis]
MKKEANYYSFFKRILNFFRDKNILFGVSFLTVLFFFVLFRNFLTFIPDPNSSHFPILRNVSFSHWMGTDEVGYDVFSRVVEGARISLIISFITVIISAVIGTFLGIISGYFGGFLDNIVLFICDFFIIFPDIILAVIIMLLIGNQSIYALIIVLSIVCISSYIRLIRAQTLVIKEKDFIKASKALGASESRIILKHIFPNIFTTLVTKMILNMSSVILAISGFGFIGLGIDRTKPEWGNILYSSREHLTNYPHLFYCPFIIILLTSFSFNLIGKGLLNCLKNDFND